MNICSVVRSHVIVITLLFSVIIVFVTSCSQEQKSTSSEKQLNLATEYQAVLLDNGQAFFGKLENAGSPYPVLKDVFYIQRMVNKETNEVTNTLVKRGSEWHGPDLMYINTKHIIMIEPVKQGSRVDVLIKDSKAKTPDAGKQQLN